MFLNRGLNRLATAADWPFLAAAFLCIVSVCTVVGIALSDSHRATEALAIQAAKSVSALVEQDISRNIELLDLSLQGVQEGFDKPELMGLPPALRQMALFDHSSTAEGVGAILVTDETGQIILSSRAATAPDVNLGDRDYFRAQQASAGIGLYMSHPYRSRTRGGDWSIGISRRLNHQDGSFAGVIVGSISLSYFQHIFSKVQRGEKSSIALYTSDGFFLARMPFIQDRIGQRLPADARFFQHDALADSGSYEQKSVVDGVHRLYTFKRVNGLPMVISVGSAIDEVFGGWWRRAFVICTALLVLCGVVVVLTLRVGRELRMRRKVEIELEHLAMTDALTGVANRRRFDEALAQEWARARRSNAMLSILMIDVDFFKSFNDRFGHQVGDRALTAVAKALQSVIKRPADLIARYGGEEFAVILPDTDITGAKFIAEQMRMAVASMETVGNSQEPLNVTISVGLGSLFPAKCDDVSKMMREADRALYLAKASGRNRVCGPLPALKLASAVAE